MAGRHRRLLAVEQFLVQLLAGAQAGEADLDVVVRLQPGQPDHLARQIDDLHRLAHVEHEDAALLALAGSAASPTPMTLACSTSPTASRTVMK